MIFIVEECFCVGKCEIGYGCVWVCVYIVEEFVSESVDLCEE